MMMICRFDGSLSYVWGVQPLRRDIHISERESTMIQGAQWDWTSPLWWYLMDVSLVSNELSIESTGRLGASAISNLKGDSYATPNKYWRWRHLSSYDSLARSGACWHTLAAPPPAQYHTWNVLLYQIRISAIRAGWEIRNVHCADIVKVFALKNTQIA